MAVPVPFSRGEHSWPRGWQSRTGNAIWEWNPENTPESRTRLDSGVKFSTTREPPGAASAEQCVVTAVLVRLLDPRRCFCLKGKILMPESAIAPAFLPRKPVVSADDSVPLVLLNLVITDHDSVEELLQKADGRERDEYALAALRIGILSLKHARGQIDADAVKHEGERLLKDLKAALDQSRNDIHTNLTNALKEYFDPSSGRFQERVERLIKQDGDLEQVLRRQVGSNGSELAKTLTAHIGENSPLMKLLNPEEAGGLVSSMRSAISGVIDEEQRSILREFSLDNDQGALKRLVNELTQANGKLKTDLAAEIGTVVQEFSLDKEDSALSRLVKRVETAEQTITKEFSLDEDGSALSRLSTVINEAKGSIDANLTLDNEGSALFRLKRELVDILNAHEKKVQAFQVDVTGALEAMKAQRKESARSTQHGNDFEAEACDFIEKEAQKAGDIATRTGRKPGLISRCLVGDLVVELGADCVAAGGRFVIEAKEDASYTVATALAEIDKAKKNRGASVGLFLFSVKTAPQGIPHLARHGDDVIVVWDAQKIESDTVLNAGLSLAKALCIRKERERNEAESNWEDLDSAILAVEKEVGRIGQMKTWTDTIQSSGEKILEELRKMKNSLEKQVASLRESVQALKQS
jgi:hypothetical protein